MQARVLYKAAFAVSLFVGSVTAHACLLGTGLGFNAVTFNTSACVADVVLSFSDKAQKQFDAQNVTVSTGGTAHGLPGSTTNQKVDLPITSLTAQVLLPKPLHGEAAGTGISFTIPYVDPDSGHGDATIGNLGIDFTKNAVIGDFWANGVKTATQTTLFNFQLTKPLSFSLTGLQPKLNVEMDHLTMTDQTAHSFASALNIDVLEPALRKLDWGALSANIFIQLRKPVSTKPFVYSPAQVPEPSTYVLIGLGFAAVFVARKRTAQAQA